MAAPGDELAIHGDYLWTDMHVTVSVAGTSAPPQPMATATTDGTGHLEVRALVPDLRAGNYRVIVTASTGEQLEADLVVQSPDMALPVAIGFLALLAVVVGAGWYTRRGSARRPGRPRTTAEAPRPTG